MARRMRARSRPPNLTMPSLKPVRLVVLFTLAVAPRAGAQDAAPGNPFAPPPSPAAARATAITGTKAPKLPDDAAARAALLTRDELAFRRTKKPLQLATLAKSLAEEADRAAVSALLESGASEVQARLAAEGFEHDLGAATSWAALELWRIARDRAVMERHVDVLHAQVVAALATPEVGGMAQMAKQRHWEHVVGVTVFVLAYAESSADEASMAGARSLAALAFGALFGATPDTVDIGGRGLVARKVGLNPGTGPIAESQAQTADTSTASGRPVEVTYTAPQDFTREDLGWATAFRATSPDRLDDGRPDPSSEARHALAIFVLPRRKALATPYATFEALWREQLDAFELGDTVVHYRGRLRCGLVVNYIGNFLHRKDRATESRAPREYAVAHVIELGGGDVLPLVSIATPNDPGLGMDTFKEGAARVALAWPLAAMLDTFALAEGHAAPSPAGGVFQPSDLIGNWETTSSAFGGFYVDSRTGAGAGAAVHSSGGHFYLRPDGTYEYALAYSTYNPQFGTSAGSTRHEGMYVLDGDVPRITPKEPIGYDFAYCAVGVGTRRMPDGLHRVLVLVGSDSEGRFLSPYIVPEWDGYRGVMDWYVDKDPIR